MEITRSANCKPYNPSQVDKDHMEHYIARVPSFGMNEILHNKWARPIRFGSRPAFPPQMEAALRHPARSAVPFFFLVVDFDMMALVSSSTTLVEHLLTIAQPSDFELATHLAQGATLLSRVSFQPEFCWML